MTEVRTISRPAAAVPVNAGTTAVTFYRNRSPMGSHRKIQGQALPDDPMPRSRDGTAFVHLSHVVRQSLTYFTGVGGPAGFGRLIGWGSGATAAVNRTANMTLEELRAAGITPQVARWWATFYQNAVNSGKGGQTAIERLKLMKRCSELLEK